MLPILQVILIRIEFPPFQEFLEFKIYRRDIPTRFGIKGVPQIVQTINLFIFVNLHNGKHKFFGLIESIEHFITRDGNRSCAFYSPLDFSCSELEWK